MTAVYLSDPNANGNGTQPYMPPKPKSTKVETYKGWANRSTWNVALWINNDYALYQAACNFMKSNPDFKNPYKAFILNQRMEGDRTPDGICYWSTRLNYKELNDMMKELLS